MHRVKNFLTGQIDLHPHLLGQSIGAGVQLLMADAALGDVHQHDHGKHALQNALGHILNVDVQLAAKGGHFGNNAHGIVSDDSDKRFHIPYPHCFW